MALAAPVVVGIMLIAAARARRRSLCGKSRTCLIVGIAVDGGHRAFLDAELFVQHLHHRRQTIGGAGSVRDDVVLGGIVRTFVHAEHDGDVFVLGGSRDDDLLHCAAQVFRGILGVGETAGGFHHHLRADAGPIDRGRIFDRENLNALAVDQQIESPSTFTVPRQGAREWSRISTDAPASWCR